MQKYMNLRQVAEEQNLKPVTLRKYIKQGKLKAFKSGNKYYVTPEDYQVFEVSRLIGNIAHDPEKLVKMTEAILKARRVDKANEILPGILGGKEDDKQKN